MWYEDGSLEETGHYQKDDVVGRILAPAYQSGRALRLRRPISNFLEFSLAWIGTVMVKRELLLRLGGFEPSLRVAEDVLLWYRLAAVADFFFVPRIAALYRQHSASLTRREMRGGGLRLAWDRVYALLRSDPAFRPYRVQLRAKVAGAHERAAYYHRALPPAAREGPDRLSPLRAVARLCTAWPAAGPAPATAGELQYHAAPTTARFVGMLKFVMARGDLSPVVQARIDALLPDPMSRSDEIQRGREECLDGVEREPVSSSTSNSWPTLCIQVPISESSCPLQKSRKSRCRSAARRAALGMAEGFTRAVGSARDRGAGCSTAARPRRRRSGPATAFSARQC